MNAAEHKARAEHLIEEGWKRVSYDAQEKYFMAAQVHATLATIPDGPPSDPDLGDSSGRESDMVKTKVAFYQSKEHPKYEVLITLPNFMEAPAHIVIRNPRDDYNETKFWHKRTEW